MDRRLFWVGIAVVGIAVAFFFGPSDERRIHRRLDRLEELMSRDGAEDSLATFGIARQVSEFFADGFVARAEPWEGTLTDRQELVGAIVRYRSTAEVITATVGDRELILQDDLGLATLLGTADVVMDFGGHRGRERRRVRIEWVEADGLWQLREVELLESMGEGIFR